MLIPELTLEQVYADRRDEQAKRYALLKEKFVSKYGREPQFFSRAPGRVNIIGEHIDYHGYGVLPMSISPDIVCAVAVNSDKSVLRLSNVQDQYQDFQVPVVVDDVTINGVDWYNYFLCGWKGVVEHCNLASPCGMDVMLDGCVPRSSGLSSSSALVCCAAMCTARANGQEFEQVAIAEVCAKCERYIGTMGGGMDQSICFMAESGKAKHIEFNPLKATTCALPDSLTFVISNSLTEVNKAAGTEFNERVVEGRAAAQILAKSQGLEWRSFKKLKQVQDALGKTFEEMVALVAAEIQPGEYTRQQLCERLEVTDEELQEVMLSPQTQGVKKFLVYNRAMHVYREAERVHQAAALNSSDPNAAQELGRLMTDSHVSCSQMYQCSSQELDELTDICRKSGALGSRLTGAGWGGCAVSAVPTDKVTSFIATVRQAYYAKDPERLAKVDIALFATNPGSGAAYLCL